MSEISLYNSTICRLCAEASNNGELLFTSKNDEPDLHSTVNRYLPLKIEDDGKLPRTICKDCKVQMEATEQFFEIILKGQQKIRELYEEQVKRQNEGKESQGGSLAVQMKTEIDSGDSIYTKNHEMVLQIEGLKSSMKQLERPCNKKTSVEVPKIKPEPMEFDSQDGEVEEITQNPQRFVEVFIKSESTREITDDEESDPHSHQNQLTTESQETISNVAAKKMVVIDRYKVRLTPQEFMKLQQKTNKNVATKKIVATDRHQVRLTPQERMKLHQKTIRNVETKKVMATDRYKVRLTPQERMQLHKEYMKKIKRSVEYVSSVNEEDEVTVDKEIAIKTQQIKYLDPKLSSRVPTEGAFLENSIVDSESPIFRCNHCSQKFRTRKACEEHMKAHTSLEKSICTMRKDTFVNELSLNKCKEATYESTKSGKGTEHSNDKSVSVRRDKVPGQNEVEN